VIGGNTSNIPGTDITGWRWWAYTKDPNGLKVTVYKKDGTKLGTKAFLNDESDIDTFSKRNVMVKTSNDERLSNEIVKGSWGLAGSDYFQYLDYDDYINVTTTIDIVNFLNGNDEAELVEKLGVASYPGNQLKDLVLVIEPATVFHSQVDGLDYFGTYWEFMWLNQNDTGNNSFNYVLGNYYFNDNKNNIFSANIQITPSQITKEKTPEIWSFLDNFRSFQSTVATQNSLGVAIILVKDVIPVVDPDLIQCPTGVIKGSCNTDFSINEPEEKECIVNNEIYKYKEVGDCGTIYCSYNMKTELNNFYLTFIPIIQSGRYFKMNSIVLNIKKTCYLEEKSDAGACHSWYNNIDKENPGKIDLSLGINNNYTNNNYTLVSLESNDDRFKVECYSYSNGKCITAKSEENIYYQLEPNTNRYISLVDMAGTAIGPGDNIIDLGGEHLTTPISLATGTHSYTINYSQSPLDKFINKINATKIEIGNYILNYTYNDKLSSENLSYSCNYKVQNSSQCICTDECCDSYCNVIECENPKDVPGGFPSLVYRPINLEEAFPGEKGIGRDPGSNWTGNVEDESGNIINKPDGTPYTKEEYYINNNRGYEDYDIYHQEPLYVIKLDYNSINEIRDYNKANNYNYNDFSLTCVNGKNCISNFLRGRVPGFYTNLITSGKCKDISSLDFESCTQRKG